MKKKYNRVFLIIVLLCLLGVAANLDSEDISKPEGEEPNGIRNEITAAESTEDSGKEAEDLEFPEGMIIPNPKEAMLPELTRISYKLYYSRAEFILRKSLHI